MSATQHAVILRHPHCPEPILEAPPMDVPPLTRESILAAWRASNEERAQSGIPPHPMPYSLMAEVVANHEAIRRQDAQDALALLIESHGLVQVKRWIRNIALLQGGE
jgi:hypothetical protein